MLYILATGTMYTDIHDRNTILNCSLKPSLPSFNSKCTIIPDAYFYADARLYASKANRTFSYEVSKAVSEGKDVILIVPEVSMIDKRLRVQAIVFRLPTSEPLSPPLDEGEKKVTIQEVLSEIIQKENMQKNDDSR